MTSAVERFIEQVFEHTIWRRVACERDLLRDETQSLLAVDEEALRAAIGGPAAMVEKLVPRHPDDVLAKMRAREQRHRTRFRPGRARVRL